MDDETQALLLQAVTDMAETLRNVAALLETIAYPRRIVTAFEPWDGETLQTLQDRGLDAGLTLRDVEDSLLPYREQLEINIQHFNGLHADAPAKNCRGCDHEEDGRVPRMTISERMVTTSGATWIPARDDRDGADDARMDNMPTADEERAQQFADEALAEAAREAEGP